MNERINLQDLSALLAEKMAITKKEAEMFLREYFEVINEELIKTKLIKIKDLGTFKLLWVEDRASVNVTTGERVLIPAHYKVAFTPDKKLAETVNEPFALFEMTEIENESGLEEIKLLPAEDVSDESESESEPELTSDEEEEIVIEKESAPLEEEKEESPEQHHYKSDNRNQLIGNRDFILLDPILDDKEEKTISKIEAENAFEKESASLEKEKEESSEQHHYKDDNKNQLIDNRDFILLDPILDDEEKEKSIPKIEAKNAFEKETDFGKELETKEEPASMDNPVVEEESPQQKSLTDENKKTVLEIKPNYGKELKNYCLSCHDHESYHLYRKKFFESQKKLKRVSIILGILFVLLVAALGYIAFRQFGEYLPFIKNSPIVVTIEPGIEKDSVPKISEALNDSIVPIEKTEETEKVEKTEEMVEMPVKKAAPEKPAPPVASTSTTKSKQITVHRGQTLRTIALEEYGNKAFWIYIYLENQRIILDPDVLPVGARITIPPASKYGIDCNNPASIQKAKNASQYP